MNAARIDSSPRLQRVLRVLKTGRRYTTRDLIRRANVCAVSACVAELRANGVEIWCERKGDVWLYWIPNQEGA